MIIYAWLYSYAWDFHSEIKTDSTVNILFIKFELLLENNVEILKMMKAFSNVV